MWLYAFLKIIARPLFRLYHRLEVHGLEHINARPYIVVGNHMSYLDPVYIAAFYPEPLHFMAKRELFKTPFMRFLLTQLGAFPVNRAGYDLGAVKQALRLLKNKSSIGLFPEGTRTQRFLEGEFKQGAAFFAIKSGVPVLPVAIFGTECALPKGVRFVRPQKVRILYGPALYPKEGESAEAFGERVKEAILALVKEGERRGWPCRREKT
ncbi:MAG: 1-acyl-sn-glycerol-3-phosphate acyltransferase [Candidatus Carbobacillus altaicus]|uniref:1-acyl-sn-glycerol-3-phosphate acyltransferase n=1 Tax=Candidatus Carbonibacillus altaicus TaxID=2163959 RepID=A0A2R6XXZ9_9BACL|nr:MAG: 1-acyl-sn-glycerol-3-phosphate acyltransferase [Candidatus Carbobacillus altaicus]